MVLTEQYIPSSFAGLHQEVDMTDETEQRAPESSSAHVTVIFINI